ncbi:MAG: polymorphic toxin type 44 domain-containing protein [Bacillota bacterium]|nr:polymorphic toxin type 44 domain-containing protein [Bacillota bacterium]
MEGNAAHGWIRAAGGGKLTVFVYDGLNVIYEETYSITSDPVSALTMSLAGLTPTSTADYVRANGLLVAKIVPGTDPSGRLSGEVATYYHPDHLGSVRVMTDSFGKVVGRMDYEPFGAFMGGAFGGERYAFTGQRNEDTPETAAANRIGLYYYGARFYDPAVGRFITADSWTNLPDDERGYMVGGNPAGYNRYTYVVNNPLLYNDPTGHDVGFAGRDGNDDWWKKNPEDLFKQTLHSTIGKVILDGVFDLLLQQNAMIARAHGQTLPWFSRVFDWFPKMVDTGAPWDIKSWKGSSGRSYVYKGQKLTYDYVGNIHFGYVGTAAGIDRFTLHLGAGANQVYSHFKNPAHHPLELGWIRTLGDDPRDFSAIDWGIRIYQAER